MRTLWANKFKIGLSLLLVAALLVSANIFLKDEQKPTTLLQKAFYTIGLSGVTYAEAPDTTVDGVDDYTEVQAVLDALPATGGKIVLYAGTYDFDNVGAGVTVARAIPNVSIEGSGYGTYIDGDGVTAVFNDGGQANWEFINLRTDAGGITKTGAGSLIMWCWIDTTLTNDLVDDTVVDGAVAEGASSNWAFDHNAALIGQHTVPADPNADKFLMWDDDPGELLWQSSTSKPSGSIFLSAQGGWPRDDNGCASPTKSETTTNKINYYTLDFDTTSDEYAQWDFSMPSDWDAGTITAVVYWTFAAPGATSETVNFAIKAGSLGNDDAIDTALGTAQTCTDIAITAGDVHVTAASSAITVAGAGASEWIVVECMRDISEDDLAGDAQLIGIMLTFTRS